MSQDFQAAQHELRWKAFLVAFRSPQAPLAIVFPAAHGNASDGAQIAIGCRGHPADLAFGTAGVDEPFNDTLCQVLGPFTGIGFAVQLITTRQYPVDLLHTVTVRIDPQEVALTFSSLLIQPQGLLPSFYQRSQSFGKLSFAIEKLKVTLGGQGCFLATGSSGHIHIQQLPGFLVIMTVTLTVLTVNPVVTRLNLGDILQSAGIQGILHY
jgi:hypothetical protein